MAHPLVSIIIPVFNAERYLAATIESALAQTWPNKEIIVVNDGSSDRSLEIAKSYQKSDVTVIDQANRGGSVARNNGFWASKGEFIQFLDHDDLLHSEKIARQMKRVGQNSACPVSGKWSRFRGDVSGTFGNWEPDASFHRDMESLDWLIAAPVLPTCCWLFPRHLIVRAGLWNESLHENPADDYEFQIRVVNLAERVLFCGEAQSYFRVENPQNAGSNKSLNALLSIYQTCNTYKSIVLSRGQTFEAKKSCSQRYFHFMYMAYPRCPELVNEAGRIIQALGFSPKKVPGTPAYEKLAAVFGWKLARRLQVARARRRKKS